MTAIEQVMLADPSWLDAVAPVGDRALGVRVARVGATAVAGVAQAWADLASRALETNVFLDPAFALPLVATGQPRPDFLLVWNGAARLIGLCPVALPRLPFAGLARGWTGKQVCLGVPLLDREQGRAAFHAMLEWLEQLRTRPAALLLTDVPADGRFAREILGPLTHRVDVLAERRRAMLCRRGNARPSSSAKSRKERQRQRRRLGEKGVCTYTSARSPEAVARACEIFLALEARGWKGARRTALAADPAHAAFARTMTRRMAETGRCRIDALEVGGRAVAMGVMLLDGGRAYFWKTAFDPDLASLSPGVQFAMELTEAQRADPATELTDSCAIPDHPMIDRLWPDRMVLRDVAITLGSRRAAGRRLGLAAERVRRRLRGPAKAMRDRLARAARRLAGID